jgi:probable phosphoglycerate mutase
MPQSTRLIALRHGETAWNVDSRIQGQLDIGLNPTGHWQAQRLAQALSGEPITAIYASDLSRAWDTAQHVARVTGLQVQPEPGLRERCFGVFQGRTFAEVELESPELARRWRQRDPHFAPEGGESLVQLFERVTTTAHTLAARHPGELIALVGHGGVLDALYRAATRLDVQAPRSWHLGNAAINRLLWSPEGLTLVGWGETAHLDADTLDESMA